MKKSIIIIIVALILLVVLFYFGTCGTFWGCPTPSDYFCVDNNKEVIKEIENIEIGKLFVEDKKTSIFMSNMNVIIQQGKSCGIVFGIKNLEPRAVEDKKFHYVIETSDLDIRKKCGIDEATANSWIITGREDTISIAPGDKYIGLFRFQIPIGSPLCNIGYRLDVKFGNESYAVDFFDITIRAK